MQNVIQLRKCILVYFDVYLDAFEIVVVGIEEIFSLDRVPKLLKNVES